MSITMSQLRAMSDEELLQISLKKNKRGCYTVEANMAMKVRRERSLHWDSLHKRPPSFERMVIEEKGTGGFIKKFK